MRHHPRHAGNRERAEPQAAFPHVPTIGTGAMRVVSAPSCSKGCPRTIRPASCAWKRTRRAPRALTELLGEVFDPAETAVAAFEVEDGRAWLLEAYFADPPDEDAIRDLARGVVGDAAGQRGVRNARPDGLGQGLAGGLEAGPRRPLPGPWRARSRNGALERPRDRDRGGARLRHRPPRHDARLSPGDRRRTQAPAAAPRAGRRHRHGLCSPSRLPRRCTSAWWRATSTRWRSRWRARTPG